MRNRLNICGNDGIVIPETSCDPCGDLVEQLRILRELVDALEQGKQDKLTQGDNINIGLGNVISARDTTYTAGNGITINGPENTINAERNASNTYTKSEVDQLIGGSALSPGDNIQISGGVISATDTTYSAGTGLSLNGTVFSADRNAGNTYTKTEVDNLLNALNHVRMTEVATLPATGEKNVIYLVPKTGGGHEMWVWDSDNNRYVDVGNDEVDLTDYIKNTDLNTASADGLVTKGTGQSNKYWRTDTAGNPAWREVVIPVNPTTEPTEQGAIWITTT